MLPDGMVSFAYNQSISSNGGVAPYRWSVSSGNLPHNVSLKASTTSTVVISGTPDTAGVASFTIQVQDASQQTASLAFSVNINNTGIAQLQAVAGGVPQGTVEIRGASAGPFNPSPWQNSTLNWIPDVRSPMFAPQTTGPWQNIYSPWPLPQTNGWLMFYGGWDGSSTPNDRVYNVFTPDFLSFGGRALVIDHGIFVHVNNVNVSQLSDGSMHMICTVLPPGITALDKPAYFYSPDGVTWNGSPEPYQAQASDVVLISNDNLYGNTDYNGGNVLLWDNNAWSLYYSDGLFDPAHARVSRATSTTPPSFISAGASLNTSHYANDVKKFQVSGKTWYLMILYEETQTNFAVYYSLSTDGASFGPESLLFKGTSTLDQYIVTPAFVLNGNSILGVLYGGNAPGPCCTEQIFGRWLQKNIIMVDSSNAPIPLQGGYGPDRAWFQVPASGLIQATITVYAEDGVTPLGKGTTSISAGQAYQLTIH